MTEFDKLPERSQELKDEEHAGDKVVEAIITALDRSFITPFDREDIHTLASKGVMKPPTLPTPFEDSGRATSEQPQLIHHLYASPPEGLIHDGNDWQGTGNRSPRA